MHRNASFARLTPALAMDKRVEFCITVTTHQCYVSDMNQLTKKTKNKCSAFITRNLLSTLYVKQI